MNLYVESSAVLAWLLGEPAGNEIASTLAGAAQVFTSELTLIECDRVLFRAAVNGVLSESAVAECRRVLGAASDRWTRFGIDTEIVSRARREFPREPVRSLDAIHLATVLVARNLVSEVTLLSLDERIRTNGESLGLMLAPEST
ncbi:MAG: type II toxin-antitoxin system VapC family toxin [Gammaproteobacteria bacterium]|nr:type II toxin-antitoxin system VapC family toxin [Gammaproteobacteria bacterium]